MTRKKKVAKPKSELIKHYVDRKAFNSDTQFVLRELDKVLTTFKKIEAINIRLGKSINKKKPSGNRRKTK